MTTGVAILGATGSIGASTLDVIERHPDRFRCVAVSANRDVDGLAAICRRHRPAVAAMADSQAAAQLAVELRSQGLPTEVLAGPAGLLAVAECQEAEQVMAAIVGAAGLLPTLAAAHCGKRVLLANKESLVMSGRLLMDAIAASGAELLPIDSEHNAIFQCMPGAYRCGAPLPGVTEILLTASGGPFLDTPLSALPGKSPDDACAHPNWEMGRKISVDSATMMNKGLEVIEAAWLFGLPAEQIRVVIHPQSVVHSMVRMDDGSVLAQMGQPDMRTPIVYGMAWPERLDGGVKPLDLVSAGPLDFRAPDVERFPCLRLAQEALVAGGAAPLVLNAANEVAVQAFLGGAIQFTTIAEVIDQAMQQSGHLDSPNDVDSIVALDADIRRLTGELIRQREGRRHHA
ncbi:MAG: 1-deoxy-D-xylulose-5-phosphate reductoisomerase [Abyssibacter sp.]|uniref:1-deoxy-D-xylulose-5-phosphate reductoisomerase n=1 Tax=Abyssibacter sp. TaxID=2320200 RepID=UPI00321C18A4